ncbi:hypothetical protein BC831DRAFT_153278 [Entophlyctis helioformis]|nr:hypothetical protein BC831DRAFT_153278 [Entophlyctis helioformis]
MAVITGSEGSPGSSTQLIRPIGHWQACSQHCCRCNLLPSMPRKRQRAPFHLTASHPLFFPSAETAQKLSVAGSQKNVKDKGDPQCSNFRASGKFEKFKGLEITGVFGSICARHSVVLRLINMSYGERFMYLDHVIEDMFKRHGDQHAIKVYYDIACQYMKHGMFPKHTDNLQFILPKFHANQRMLDMTS